MTRSLERALAGAPVRVGTENPAKCEAVRRALARLRPAENEEGELRIVPVGVSSGVAEQPFGFEEIAVGARTRARAALDSGESVLAFGIEDGLVRLADGRDGSIDPIYNVGCAFVTDGEREGVGFSSGFAYPPACVGPAVTDRSPIGDLFDGLWRAQRGSLDAMPSGRNEGNIGKLSAGRLTRAEYGAQAVLCALIRFLHRDLYD